MNRFAVAPVAPAQHESLVDLLLELHAHYIQPPTATRDEVRRHLLTNLLSGSSPPCLLVAAGEDHRVMGFAALVLMHSWVEPGPDHRRQCLLKELYVSASCRSQGVGQALLREAARYAVDQGCGRMDWNVKASNHRGIEFYQSLGGRPVDDRLSFRLSRSALEDLVQPPEDP